MNVTLPKRQIAAILGIGLVRVQKLAQTDQIERVQTDAGTLYLVEPQRLRKEEHRRRWLAWQARQREAAPGVAVGEAWARAGEKEREQARARKRLIESWEDHLARASVTTRRGARAATEGFLREQRAAGVRLSRSTLYTWRRRLHTKGLEGLLPDADRQPTRMPEDLRQAIDALWLSENRRSAAQCRRLVLASYHTPEIVPTVRTIERYVRSIDRASTILGREGRKAFADQVEPYAEREAPAPLVAFVGDHHQLDIAVLGLDGKPCRPWLTAWMDRGSRVIVGWQLSDKAPNTDVILAACGRAFARWGAPEEIVIDNGRDFTARAFAGESRRVRIAVDEKVFLSALELANVRVRFALPCNPRGKGDLERFFGTHEGQFCKEFPTYLSRTPSERPEAMRVPYAEMTNLPTLREVDRLLGEWIERCYHVQPHGGLGGRSPRAVLDEALRTGEAVKRPVKDVVLRQLFMPSAPVKVTRNGVRVGATGLGYWSAELVPFFGQTVVARYSMDDLGHVAVYDLKGKFLCVVPARERLAHGATAEQLRQVQADKREARRAARKYQDVREETMREPNPLKRVVAKAPAPEPPPRPKVSALHRTQLDGEAEKAEAGLAAARETGARAARPEDRAAAVQRMLAAAGPPVSPRETAKRRAAEVARRLFGDDDE